MARLLATYRLQMNAGFTLAQALARVDYFARLGVSHLYLSPIFAARRGSLHGYDVVDPTRINPELGTDADLRALSRALAERDMGILLDIVPNHMGIGAENARWDDVLTHGERSRYARWFDIDWSGGRRQAWRGKVVLPVLGDTLDATLGRGELSVRVREGGRPRVHYFERSFPLDPASLPPELQLAAFDPEETGELADLFSGAAGRERLRELLDAQHYRLVHWRDGRGEINYRRFFDVNDLAGVRVEDDAVFDESHALVLALAREGVVDGVRVDHVDGLLDPLAYLRKLRAALPRGALLFVEKILSAGETLRPEWPVDGTTGYEFMNDLEDVLLDAEGFARIEKAYRRHRRLAAGTTFRAIARGAKLAVLRGALRADVARLADLAAAALIAASPPVPMADLEGAIMELVASLPAYRTYLDGRPAIDDADRALIEGARCDAQAQAPLLAGAIDVVADLLLDRVAAADAAARIAFVSRFQQVSGPAAAKGVEDTALYVYLPLASRNEVGGSPDRPLADAVVRLHHENAVRAERWPATLLATNTHDTKRSADVRARLDALSELPREWERAIQRWKRLNAKHRRPVKGRLAPDANTEYLLYQTLVALWPPPRPGRRVDDLPDRAWRDAVRERLVRYALKAAREAKTSTSWVDPSAEYEGALREFVERMLEPSEDAPFLPDVARLVARLAPIGAANTLSRIALHLTSPGTPDLYQGDELWSFTLVDPDNREPVDFDLRERLFDESVQDLSSVAPYDHRLKLGVTSRLLKLRRDRPELFVRGGYEPLRVAGPRADHVVAFARAHGGGRVVTVAARLPCELIGSGDPGVWWAGTTLQIPSSAAARWRSVLTGDEIDGGTIELGALLRTIPVAVLID